MILVLKCINFYVIYCRVEFDENDFKIFVSGFSFQDQIEVVFFYFGDKDILVYVIEIKDLLNIDIVWLLLDFFEGKVVIKLFVKC